MPYGDFAGAIEEDFGGFQPFRKQLAEVASTIMINIDIGTAA
jgi:superoxide dismutase